MAKRIKARRRLDAKTAKDKAKAERKAQPKSKAKARQPPKPKVKFSPRETVRFILPEPEWKTEDIAAYAEKLAKEHLGVLTIFVEQELDDLYRLQSEIIDFNESCLWFSPPVVSMSSFKANVKELRMTAGRASKQNRPKINEIIRLYEEKRIPNFFDSRERHQPTGSAIQ